jgi:CheY-like chemotaxis protein
MSGNGCAGHAEPSRTVLLIAGRLARVALIAAVVARLSQVQVTAVMQSRRKRALAAARPPALVRVSLDRPAMAGLARVRRRQAERALRRIPIMTFGSASTASLAG